MSGFEIRTNRLVLRQLTSADAARIAELGGDWDVASMTSRMPYPYTVHAAYQWIDDLETGEKVFGITHAGELTGITGYTLAPDHRSAEIGYWIGKPYWDQGYCTEAARAVLKYGFEILGLHRIFARHFTRNPASGRVLQKIGMIHEGTLREAFKKWGRFEDMEVYGILKSEKSKRREE